VRFLKGVVSTVVSLFVTDWTQTAGIVVILVLGYVAIKVLRLPAAGFVVALLLCLHLVYTTASEARRRRA
jgi:uncharacterized membrane protein AbrB (regulator of aidB expression)